MVDADAWLFSHRYVYSDREDNRIATASLESTEEHDIAGDEEALFSESTIEETIQFKEKARRLEDIARGLEEARDNRDWEEVVDLVYDLMSESEALIETANEFSKGEKQ